MTKVAAGKAKGKSRIKGKAGTAAKASAAVKAAQRRSKAKARSPVPAAKRATRSVAAAAPRAKAAGAVRKLTIDEARAIWFVRQGLAARVEQTSEAQLAASGWLRTLAGTYASAWARQRGFRRKHLDRPVFETGSIVNVPSVHSCVMLVPLADAGLSLRAAQPGIERNAQRAAEKCGFELREVEDLCRAVVAALRARPLAPEELREALGGKVRSLGEAGKKIGESSTLTVALKLLATRGQVQRLPDGGRLDSARLRYGLFARDPFEAATQPADDAAMDQALVARHLRWAAPATLDEIARWTDIGKKRAQVALAALGAAELEVDGEAHWAPAGDGMLEATTEPERRFAFVPADDNSVDLRSSVDRLLPAEYRDVTLAGQRLAEQNMWSFHLLLDRGRLIGVWDVEPASKEIVWRTFGRLGAAERQAIYAEAAALTSFVRDELGDLKLSSIDSTATRLARVAAIGAL